MSVIKFENVTFQYSNSKEVLKDITFEVESNSTTILLGKNGSGKSTLLKLLMYFEKPQRRNNITLNNKIVSMNTPYWSDQKRLLMLVKMYLINLIFQ